MVPLKSVDGAECGGVAFFRLDTGQKKTREESCQNVPNLPAAAGAGVVFKIFLGG